MAITDRRGIDRWLEPLAERLWPGLKYATSYTRHEDLGSVFGAVFGLPLALGGLAWLIAVTDWQALADQWPLLLLFLVLEIVLEELDFFFTADPQQGVYFQFNGSLSTVVFVSAFLIAGPNALWVRVAESLIQFVRNYRRYPFHSSRWNEVRVRLLRVAEGTLVALAALAVYHWWGGAYPPTGVTIAALLPANFAAAVWVLASRFVWLPYIAYMSHDDFFHGTLAARWRAIWTTLAGTMWPAVIAPLGILAAGLYGGQGLPAYCALMAGMVVMGAMAHALSTVARNTNYRTRELRMLDQLAQAILETPPGSVDLPNLLAHCLPDMFQMSIVSIRLFPYQTLAHHPREYPAIDEGLWQWSQTICEPHIFPPNSNLPWGGPPNMRNLLIVPIARAETTETMGCIYIARRSYRGPIEEVLPAAQSLAALVASTLHSARSYQETLELERSTQELSIAGQIQSSFLPDTPPDVEGWELSAVLNPARETSGDFYDMIPMWDGRLGVLVADVADKGVGAALYMALTRTLLRTFAIEFSTRYPENYYFHPERVLNTVNQRITDDTHSDMFVTLFYGIIDPGTASFTYANAGHNPPLLFSRANGSLEVRRLVRTGLPVGLFKDHVWERGSVRLERGDVLVMYTDGVTEAQNDDHECFGEERLQAVATAYLGESAQTIQQAIVSAARDFADDAPQFDDLTLLVVRYAS